MLMVVFLTIELKLVYDSYRNSNRNVAGNSEIVNKKGFNKILEKIK